MSGRRRGLRHPPEEVSPEDAALALDLYPLTVPHRRGPGCPASDVGAATCSCPAQPSDPDLREKKAWAYDVTRRIVEKTAELHLLIAEAHEGKAHRYMYPPMTWDAYVQKYFDIGRKMAHKYLVQNRVITTLEAVVVEVRPDATIRLTIPTPRTQAINRALPDAEEALRFLLERGMDPERAINAVIEYFGGQPNRSDLDALAEVPGVKEAAEPYIRLLDVAEGPDPYAHRRAVGLLVAMRRSPQPHEAWVRALTFAQRERLAAEIGAAEKWLRTLRATVRATPTGKPDLAPRTPPPPRRVPMSTTVDTPPAE